jgi:LysM domain
MSAAPELPPIVFIPDRARGHRPVRRPNRLVIVPGHATRDPGVGSDANADWSATSWHRSATPSVDLAATAGAHSAPVRLTRRGVTVLGLAAIVAASAVALFSWMSAPAPTAQPAVPAAITVQPGDTLWSIAQSVAPNRDPRAEVDDLTRINHLGSASLAPGQVIRTH